MCSDVSIIVENDYFDTMEREIRAVDMAHWDAEDGKYRAEVTGHQEINSSASDTWTKNLEYVGGETGVVVRIDYRVSRNGSWGGIEHAYSDSFRCVDHGV